MVGLIAAIASLAVKHFKGERSNKKGMPVTFAQRAFTFSLVLAEVTAIWDIITGVSGRGHFGLLATIYRFSGDFPGDQSEAVLPARDLAG